MPKDHGIGASVKRREDIRFLTGTGHYTDDVTIYGQAYAVFVRSNVAHGKTNRVHAAKWPKRALGAAPNRDKTNQPTEIGAGRADFSRGCGVSPGSLHRTSELSSI